MTEIINIQDGNGEFLSFTQGEWEFNPVTGESVGTELYFEANALFDKGEYSAAAALFAEALTTDIHYKTYERLGQCFTALGMPRKAIPNYLAATALNRQVHAPYRCAEAFVAIGELTYAKQMLDTVLSREPRHRKALKLKAQLIAACTNR